MRYPVDPPQTVRTPPPTAFARWLTGQLTGSAKHALVVRVRPGYVERAYAATRRLDTGEEVLMQPIVASADQYPPWVGTWTPLGPWRTLPNIQNTKWSRGFQQNGSGAGTVVMDNVIFEEQEGIAGIFHNIRRGYFSPSRGVVLSTRPSLWEDTGWTNALNGGYQVEFWEGYGSGAEVVPLDEPDPVTNSCAPPGGAISRTWTGIIETVDLESHPDHITITARDFGVLFTDQRLQSTNKAAEIVAPTTFADQSHSQGLRPVGARQPFVDIFEVAWFDDFSNDVLSLYTSVTGDASAGGTALVIGTGGATLTPNVYWQGGLLSFLPELGSLGDPMERTQGWTVRAPGVFSVHVTSAGEVKVRDPAGVLLGGGIFPPGLASGPFTGAFYLYWDNVSGTVWIGSGNVGSDGALEWIYGVPGVAIATEANQPEITFTEGDAADGRYQALGITSDIPVTLPGERISTAEAAHAATVGSTTVSSHFTGASSTDYDTSELWLSAIQDIPQAVQHIDIDVSRAWKPPTRFVNGDSAPQNESALTGAPLTGYAAQLAPGAPTEMGTLTVALHPHGGPITDLTVTPMVHGALEGAMLLVTDPTGSFSQFFTVAVTVPGLSGGTDITVVSETPVYAFPIGSTVQRAGNEVTYAGLGQFRLFTMTPLWSGCEMWVSVHMDEDGLMDGKPVGAGWVDLGHGNTPDGVPYLLHVPDFAFTEGGPMTFDLGHVFDTNNLFAFNDDGSISGEFYSDTAVPGAKLRLTLRQLKFGAPTTTPNPAYISDSDLAALIAELGVGNNYITGVQDFNLFVFYPWAPGPGGVVTKLAKTVPFGPASSLHVEPLTAPVLAGQRIVLVTPDGEGQQMFTVRHDRAVGATEIDVLNAKVQFGGFPATSTVQFNENFITAPPATNLGGVGTLQEIDSYPAGDAVSGSVNAVHWVLVSDAIEVIEVLCKWAGFKEWNLEWFGWSLVNPMQYGSDKFFIDIINDILAQGNFVFFMDGPTDDDRSIGVPCFVHQSAASAPPTNIVEVTDQNLLETVSVKWDLSTLPYVLRYRGNPTDGGLAYEEDLVATFAATYFPPWAGSDYVPLDGSAAPDPPLRRTAGVVRHFTQTVGVNVPIGLNSDEQCLFACLLATLQYAIATGTGQLQVAGIDAFTLNQQIGVVDEADGINSRMWLASVESTHTMGTSGKWEMVLGGSFIDTEDMELVIADYDYALTQVTPQQPTGERYVGVPTSAIGRFQAAVGA